jgi:integrase/recombinase XerD
LHYLTESSARSHCHSGRLQEKSGKRNELPCHHTVERLLKEYVAAAGIAPDAEGPLFRAWRGGALHRRPLDSAAKSGNHSFRAAGITNYLNNGGKLELARRMAAHASAAPPRSTSAAATKISLAEIERISY